MFRTILKHLQKFFPKTTKTSIFKKNLALLLVSILLSSISLQALAANITVDSNDDDNNFANGNCSLREAVFSVNNGGDPNRDNCTPGDPGNALDQIDFNAPMSITLNSELPQITSPVVIDGDIDNDNFADVTIDASGIAGGGRVFDLNPAASGGTTATVRGFSFLNGASSGNGGTILARTGAELEVTDSSIDSTTANGNGGAIAVEQGANLNLDNLNITGSTSDLHAGAIYVEGNSNVLTNDVNIRNTTADGNGGAVFIGSTGGASTADFNNSTINADGVGNSHAGGNGGAIYVEGNSTLRINDDGVSNAQIQNSSADGNGGAIYYQFGTTQTFPVIRNTLLRGNSAVGSGGAIEVGQKHQLYLQNSNLLFNSADSGGAIHFFGGTGPADADTSSVIDSTLFGNSSTNDGGAIYQNPFRTFSASNSIFEDNQSIAGSGGAVYNAGVSANTSFTDSTFTNNSALNNGGAIDYEVGGGNLSIFNTGFNANHSDAGSGGAIYLNNSAFLQTGLETNFNNNQALTGSGGAINFMLNSSGSVDNTIFTFNSAEEGGAVAFHGAEATFSDTDLTFNSADSGGAISALTFVRGSNPQFTSCSIDENSATNYGSAGHVDSGSSIRFVGGLKKSISRNNAVLGGTFYSQDGSVHLENAFMNNNNNISNSDGGVILSNGGSLELINSEIMNHDISSLIDITDPTGSVTVSGVNVHDNVSTNRGIFWFEDTDGLPSTTSLIIDNSSNFEQNTSLNSSNLVLQTDDLTIQDTTFNSNSAFGAGLAGSVEANATLINIDGTVFNNNQSPSTGAAILNGETVNISNSAITNNTGTALLGGLSVVSTVGGVLSNLDFFNNIGGQVGGLNILSSFSLTLENSSIRANNGTDIGGAVLEGAIDVINSTISGNAGDSVGGIYAGDYSSTSPTAVNFTNTTIAFNQANIDSALSAGGLFVGDNVNPVEVNLGNTIISDNTSPVGLSGPECLVNGGAILTSSGNSLINDLTNCNYLAGPNDITGVSAGLDPFLSLNGGTTYNHLLNFNSPAIDAANSLIAPATDQRGVPRPQGTADDIGATEYIDNIAPILAQVNPVPSPSTNTSPIYTFSSTEAGTITYGGACSSLTTSAVAANNTVTFNTLPPATYVGCSITVTDSYLNSSIPLIVSPFTITTPTSGGGGGGGSGGPFGGQSCSGSSCSNVPSQPNSPAQPAQPINPVQPLQPITPVQPSQPNIPSQPSQPSVPAIGGPGPSSNNSGKLPVVSKPSVQPTQPELTQPTESAIEPTQPETPSTPEQPVITRPAATKSTRPLSLTIVTPEENQKSADDSPFVTGQGPTQKNTEIYLFESKDFDPIRTRLQQELDAVQPALNQQEKQQQYRIQFTNAVIDILEKSLNSDLDPKNSEEAIFLNKILRLGNTSTGGNGVFLLDSDKTLQDNQYLIIARQPAANKGQLSTYSQERNFTIDSSLKVLTPEIKSLGNQPISAQTLLGNLRVEIAPGNYRPVLVGNIKEASKIVANWQSDVVTSALIADTLDQEFRLTSPVALEPGDHHVYVTAYRRSDNAQSQTLKIPFTIKPGNTGLVLPDYWWIIAAAAGGVFLLFLIIFLIKRRQKTTDIPVAEPMATVNQPAQNDQMFKAIFADQGEDFLKNNQSVNPQNIPTPPGGITSIPIPPGGIVSSNSNSPSSHESTTFNASPSPNTTITENNPNQSTGTPNSTDLPTDSKTI